MPWRRGAAQRLVRCGIFDVDRVDFDPQDGRPVRQFTIIEAPDWINVIALTPERHVLLVRQYRYGTESFTVEIPGGMCDPGESPLETARRELREETGFVGATIEELGWVFPNPAIQGNRCWTYLVRDVRKVSEPTPDTNEAFEQLQVPLSEIPGMIKNGEINHSLVVAAFRLLEDDEFRR